MDSIKNHSNEISSQKARTEKALTHISKKYHELTETAALAKSLAPDLKLELSRKEIFEEPDIRKKIIMILMWGYPRDLRNTPTILKNLDTIIKIDEQYRSNSILGKEYYEKLIKIERLGMSTASKILYFMEVKVEQNDAIIVDSRVKSGFALFNEFSDFASSSSDDADYYIKAVEKIGLISQDINCNADDLERYLYVIGSKWDLFLKDQKRKLLKKADPKFIKKLLNYSKK